MYRVAPMIVLGLLVASIGAGPGAPSTADPQRPAGGGIMLETLRFDPASAAVKQTKTHFRRSDKYWVVLAGSFTVKPRPGQQLVPQVCDWFYCAVEGGNPAASGFVVQIDSTRNRDIGPLSQLFKFGAQFATRPPYEETHVYESQPAHLNVPVGDALTIGSLLSNCLPGPNARIVCAGELTLEVWVAGDLPAPPGNQTPQCTRKGTDGNDTITGTPHRDVICGLGGNDTIRGLGGDDTLDGGAGDDTLDGGAGVDELRGKAGNDLLKARDGEADKLVDGGTGQDTAEIDRGRDPTRAVEILK